MGRHFSIACLHLSTALFFFQLFLPIFPFFGIFRLINFLKGKVGGQVGMTRFVGWKVSNFCDAKKGSAFQQGDVLEIGQVSGSE